MMNRCRRCGADARGGNCSALYEGLCADCAEELLDAQEAGETLAEAAYAHQDATAQEYRRRACTVAQLGDWPAFFAAAADCARALNARDAVVDRALLRI